METNNEKKYTVEYISTIVEKLHSMKDKKVSYRCYGAINGRNIIEYFSMTEEEMCALQDIQAIYPEKPLSLLLPMFEEEFGFAGMHTEFEGEDNFQVEHIDWTPIYVYDFSYEIRGKKYTDCVELDNQEYSELLSFDFQGDGFNFPLFMFSNPSLCGKILRRINDKCLCHEIVFDKSFRIFFDEIEADKSLILKQDL